MLICLTCSNNKTVCLNAGGWHKLSAHMHNKLSRILIWAEVCPNLVVVLKNTCSHAPQVVPVGLFGTVSTPDFGAACIHPHRLATRDRKWNDDLSSTANTAYGRKWTVLWKKKKKKVESCKRRAGNKRAVGGSRVAGAEAEGAKGEGFGSEMNNTLIMIITSIILRSRQWGVSTQPAANTVSCL